jgi:hypothetical protein
MTEDNKCQILVNQVNRKFKLAMKMYLQKKAVCYYIIQ